MKTRSWVLITWLSALVLSCGKDLPPVSKELHLGFKDVFQCKSSYFGNESPSRAGGREVETFVSGQHYASKEPILLLLEDEVLAIRIEAKPSLERIPTGRNYVENSDKRMQIELRVRHKPSDTELAYVYGVTELGMNAYKFAIPEREMGGIRVNRLSVLCSLTNTSG